MTHADPRLLLTYQALKGARTPRRTLCARLAAMLARLAEADRRNRDILRLREMPDYLLRDIGLDRGDISHRARR
jgi:uncharacterized protein YjiS (DUF1127 family)